MLTPVKGWQEERKEKLLLPALKLEPSQDGLMEPGGEDVKRKNERGESEILFFKRHLRRGEGRDRKTE